MATSKELLAPKEITRKELAELVDAWVAEGNEITQVAPGVALNFRTPESPKVPIPKKIRKLRRLKEAAIAPKVVKRTKTKTKTKTKKRK
jgi:hypothetical protein